MACQCTHEAHEIRDAIHALTAAIEAQTQAIETVADDFGTALDSALLVHAITNGLLTNKQSWEAIGKVASRGRISTSEQLAETVARLLKEFP